MTSLFCRCGVGGDAFFCDDDGPDVSVGLKDELIDAGDAVIADG